MAEEANLPETLTLEQAYRAAYFLTETYLDLETAPDEGLILFHEYLKSDPARWQDWKDAIREALRQDAASDPLTEKLLRD